MEAKHILNRVTVTGADDNTSVLHMIDISCMFPFVEWGLLVSERGTLDGGRPRFPSKSWLDAFVAQRESAARDGKIINYTLHLCGRWVRELCKGNLDFPAHDDLQQLWDGAKRVQLNFHAYTHLVECGAFHKLLGAFPDKQWIFQLDGVNNVICAEARSAGVDAVPLFDISGGAGTLPETWPQQIKGVYSGYAGGLSPTNVARQLEKISTVANYPPIWIDAETKLRSPDDMWLDMKKVMEYLKAAKPWMIRQ